MHPSSSSSSQPPDHPKHPPPPAMGYPAPPPDPTYFGAAPPAAAANGHAAPFGVAYPYPIPPHHPHPHPHPPPYHYYPPPPHHHHHHPYPPPTCLRRLLAFFVAGFLLVGAVIFVIWLLVRPRAPGFSLAALSVSNLSSYPSTNSTLSASFAVSLVSSNPNSKLSVSYFSSIASVSLTPSSPLAVVSLPPFSVAPHNTTTLAFRLAVDGEYVGPDAAAELRRGSGVVKFQVRVMAVAVFEQGGWRTRRRVVRVMCGGVPVAFRGKNATAAAFDGPPQPCYVGM